LALERDRKDSDKFSLRSWRRVCGGSSSSTASTGGASGGAPSAGMKI
jgi:hypothetical protein